MRTKLEAYKIRGMTVRDINHATAGAQYLPPKHTKFPYWTTLRPKKCFSITNREQPLRNIVLISL